MRLEEEGGVSINIAVDAMFIPGGAFDGLSLITCPTHKQHVSIVRQRPCKGRKCARFAYGGLEKAEADMG